jgi:hypothetical protein
MKRKCCMIALSIVTCCQGFGQSLRQPVSTVYNNLAVYSTQQADVLSYLNNQAAMAQLKNIAAGVYGENRFLLAATSVYTAAAAMSTRNGNFEISMRYSGFKNYNEGQAGLGYARSAGKNIDIGIQFNYYNYRVAGYGTAGTITVEVGTILHLTDKVNLGIHVYNPVGGNFSKTGEKLTSIINAGVGYDVNDHFFIGAEIVKEENFAASFNIGVQYHFVKRFFARAGISSGTSAGYAGFGIAWNNLRLDLTGSYHPQLGFSPGLLLIINVGKQSKTVDDEEQ